MGPPSERAKVSTVLRSRLRERVRERVRDRVRERERRERRRGDADRRLVREGVRE